MSKYLELKAQIEALNEQLEATRIAEFMEQVEGIKARIDAFGIKPADLFSSQELTGKPPTPKRIRRAPKYTLDGHTWSGDGRVPRWYQDALRAGKTPDEMLVKKAA